MTLGIFLIQRNYVQQKKLIIKLIIERLTYYLVVLCFYTD